MSFFTDDKVESALDWLFPHGPNHASSRTNCILAVTNAAVDEWNTCVQRRNPNPAVLLKSHDILADVDDTHGHLGICLTDSVLSDLDDPVCAPPHILTLKVCTA
jgi:hypothetical protein